jgi:predicted nucleic acid-binding protein
MTTLVDTSVWRHYFNGTLSTDAARMDALLDQDDALACHPAVLGELILGGLSTQHEGLLAQLPRLAEVSSQDLLVFIRTHKLAHKGVGWVDSQLLASAVNANARLWAIDKGLRAAADSLGVAFRMPAEGARSFAADDTTEAAPSSQKKKLQSDVKT